MHLNMNKMLRVFAANLNKVKQGAIKYFAIKFSVFYGVNCKTFLITLYYR